AFRRLIGKGRFTAPHDIHVERISIAERIAQVALLLERDGSTSFEALVRGSRHREEAITTFLALLEMARLQPLRLTQGERLGDLHVVARAAAIGTLGEEAAGMMDAGSDYGSASPSGRSDADVDDDDSD